MNPKCRLFLAISLVVLVFCATPLKANAKGSQVTLGVSVQPSGPGTINDFDYSEVNPDEKVASNNAVPDTKGEVKGVTTVEQNNQTSSFLISVKVFFRSALQKLFGLF